MLVFLVSLENNVCIVGISTRIVTRWCELGIKYTLQEEWLKKKEISDISSCGIVTLIY